MQHTQIDTSVYDTCTGLPFNEENIVLANRVAVVWSSWIVNLTKGRSIQIELSRDK